MRRVDSTTLGPGQYRVQTRSNFVRTFRSRETREARWRAPRTGLWHRCGTWIMHDWIEQPRGAGDALVE